MVVKLKDASFVFPLIAEQHVANMQERTSSNFAPPSNCCVQLNGDFQGISLVSHELRSFVEE